MERRREGAESLLFACSGHNRPFVSLLVFLFTVPSSICVSVQSTYCKAIQDHCAAAGRTVRVINLDPAAEAFKYACSIDIRDLISVDDVMQEMGYGPNGALIFAME